MKVTLLSYTINNEHLAALAASVCVDKEPTQKGMMTAINSGHHSILEHLPLTWLVEDISRACSHQLVRHRIGFSYSQQSQRYAKVDTTKEWCLMPESILKGGLNIRTGYEELMEAIAHFYNEMLSKGIPNEDARFILPNACYTSLVISCNARSFIHACTLRCCNKTQWELRELFTTMRESIKEIYPHVYPLCYPNCTKQGCTESKSCSSPYSIRNEG